MDHCGIARAAAAGFSLGGMIARRFAQDAPERSAALVVLNSPHRCSPEAQAAILARVEQARAEGPQATVEAALERWFPAPFRQANPALMETVRGRVTANDRAIQHIIYRVLAEGTEEIVAPDPPIACPALIVTAEEDFGNGPEMTRAIAAEIPRIPRAQVAILPGLRHMAPAEDPEALNRPLRAFLDELEPRP